jgi:DNA-binding Lrp family transcriptional regulator
MVQMLEDGIPQKETAEYLGVSVPTLKKVIDEIQQKEGILLNWRAVRSLQLTELQAAILSHITPAKMEEASLKDLVLAYKVLAEKEDEIENPEQKKMTGLVSYLIELEKRNYVLDQSGRTIDVTSRSEVEDAEGKVFDEYGEVPQF